MSGPDHYQRMRESSDQSGARDNEVRFVGTGQGSFAGEEMNLHPDSSYGALYVTEPAAVWSPYPDAQGSVWVNEGLKNEDMDDYRGRTDS
jgi:hypothetical protein